MRRRHALICSLVALIAAQGFATGADASSRAAKTGHVVSVVAAENFWGSLVAQIGGVHAQVTSIVTDPNADPHEYEANSSDARAFAEANFVILNGVGYDDWASKLLSASTNSSRKVLTVANLFGVRAGGNPHLWYNPTYVFATINKIAAELEAIDPSDAPYFRTQLSRVDASFSTYRHLLASIKAKFAGRKVASTESIFVYLARYLDLDLVTPSTFMDAISEGNEPSARSVVTFQEQIAGRQFAVLVYNRQTITAVTTNIKAQADAKGIPSVGISETIEPPTDSFQQWMDGELTSLSNALAHKASAST